MNSVSKLDDYAGIDLFPVQPAITKTDGISGMLKMYYYDAGGMECVYYVPLHELTIENDKIKHKAFRHDHDHTIWDEQLVHKFTIEVYSEQLNGKEIGLELTPGYRFPSGDIHFCWPDDIVVELK